MHIAQRTTHNKRHQLHAIYLLLVEFLHDIDHDAAEGETEMEKKSAAIELLHFKMSLLFRFGFTGSNHHTVK